MLGGGSSNRDVAGIRVAGESLSKRIAAAQAAGIVVFVQLRHRPITVVGTQSMPPRRLRTQRRCASSIDWRARRGYACNVVGKRPTAS